jgi:hypothetical protein
VQRSAVSVVWLTLNGWYRQVLIHNIFVEEGLRHDTVSDAYNNPAITNRHRVLRGLDLRKACVVLNMYSAGLR